MKMEKAAWIGHESDFSMSMGICKVDKENRMVHGWATLDNPDRQDDVVEASASEKAFSRFGGNIREMHDKIAAGRLVSYRPQTFVDKDGKKYNGFFVSAYVSKGAEPTWQKVLDRTLNAFSIKGPVYKYEHRYHDELEKSLRHILDYDLEEISLVDSGGNQLANIVSIQKDKDGGVSVTGMYEGVTIENIFLCPEDRIAETSAAKKLSCQNGHDMKNIGWVEVNDSKAETVSKAVDDYFETSNEGGVEEMADTKVEVEKAVDVDEAGTATDAAAVEQAAHIPENEETVPVETENAEVEEDEEAEESQEEGFDVEKAFSGVAESLTKLADLIAEGFTTLASDVNKRLDSVDQKADATAEAVTKAVDEVKEELSEVSKSVETLEGETALKKSGDLGGSTEPVEVKKTGKWAGSIL